MDLAARTERAREEALADTLDISVIPRRAEVIPKLEALNEPQDRVETLAARTPAAGHELAELPPATTEPSSVAERHPRLSPAVASPDAINLDRPIDTQATGPLSGAAAPAMAARKPKESFTIQISIELDRLLRDESVRRTNEAGRRVRISELVTKAFTADRVPKDVTEAEALVCRLPEAMASDSTTTTSVRVDEITRRRLALLHARLTQARSPARMRELYTALILDHLGELPRRAQRELDG
jgi:hypothetical protein